MVEECQEEAIKSEKRCFLSFYSYSFPPLNRLVRCKVLALQWSCRCIRKCCCCWPKDLLSLFPIIECTHACSAKSVDQEKGKKKKMKKEIQAPTHSSSGALLILVQQKLHRRQQFQSHLLARPGIWRSTLESGCLPSLSKQPSRQLKLKLLGHLSLVTFVNSLLLLVKLLMTKLASRRPSFLLLPPTAQTSVCKQVALIKWQTMAALSEHNPWISWNMLPVSSATMFQQTYYYMCVCAL